MPYLYGGRILRVDLTTHQVRAVSTERYASRYVGGRALNAALIYEAIDGATDPLGPENVLCFGTGPLTGTTFPGSSRVEVMCKSPVSGYLGHANMGGDWPAELKNAGWDAVVLEGRSATPVYVLIRNDEVEIRDARPYWGMTTYATQAAIRNDLNNENYKVAAIGPAGENQVTFAAVNSGISNSASRTGVGAVMGSKNCKAIVVRGTKGVAVADPKAFLETCLATHNWIRSQESFAEYHEIGLLVDECAYVRSGLEASGDAHATAPSYDGAFDFRELFNEYGYKRTGCTGCPLHCMEAYNVPGIGANAMKCESYPELSAEWRNFDMKFMFKMSLFSDEQGLDITSLSTIFTWMQYLWELGIIDESITDGIQLDWGNQDGLVALAWNVVNRRGLGDKLAGGMRATADYLDSRIPLERRGGTSIYDTAMQVNNNPMFGVSPRVHGMALAYVVGRRCDPLADHDAEELAVLSAPVYPTMSEEQRSEFAARGQAEETRLGGTPEAGELQGYKGKAAMVHDMGMIVGLADMLGTCKWHTKWLYMYVDESHYAEALSSGTGRIVAPEDLLAASLRMRNLERALECKLGRRRENDTIPAKEFGKTIARGWAKGKVEISREGLERMKSEYYAIRGWDLATGVPFKETLLKFGLDDVAADLASLGILPERTETETAKAMKDPKLAHVLIEAAETGLREV